MVAKELNDGSSFVIGLSGGSLPKFFILAAQQVTNDAILLDINGHKIYYTSVSGLKIALTYSHCIEDKTFIDHSPLN